MTCGCGSNSCGCGVEVHIHDAESKRRGPYVFPKRKAYPIGNLEHAKLALTFSTWPDNKPDAKKVRDAVFKRYPELRDWFKDGKYEKHAESFDAEYELIGRRQPRKSTFKVSDLKEALKNANDDAHIFVGDIAAVDEDMLGEPIVSSPRGVWAGADGDDVYILGAKDWIHTDQIDELTWNRVDRAKDAESFDAECEVCEKEIVGQEGGVGLTTGGRAHYECMGWNDAESFDAEKIEGQTQSNIYAKFFVGHVSKDELRGNGKFKTYDSAVKKAKEVAKKEGNSRVVSPMGAALWTSNDKGLFQAGHLTKEAKRFYNSEEEMATSYLSAESILYDAPMSTYDDYCIGQGRFCVSERLPGKDLCRNCDAEFGEMFPQNAEYTALGVPLRRIPAKDIMSPGARATRMGLLVLATVVILSASTQGSPIPKGA